MKAEWVERSAVNNRHRLDRVDKSGEQVKKTSAVVPVMILDERIESHKMVSPTLSALLIEF
jgi:hypothetical protein